MFCHSWLHKDRITVIVVSPTARHAIVSVAGICQTAGSVTSVKLLLCFAVKPVPIAGSWRRNSRDAWGPRGHRSPEKCPAIHRCCNRAGDRPACFDQIFWAREFCSVKSTRALLKFENRTALAATNSIRAKEDRFGRYGSASRTILLRYCPGAAHFRPIPSF